MKVTAEDLRARHTKIMTPTVEITLTPDGRHIEVRSPYSEEVVAACRAVGCGRWDAPVWRFPALPDAARALRDTLPGGQAYAELLLPLTAQAAGRDEIAANGPSDSFPADRLLTPGVALWPHQLRAVQLIRHSAAAMLALDMGTGKTLAALTALEATGARRVLIFAPRFVVSGWEREAQEKLANPPRFFCLSSEAGKIAKRVAALKAALAQADADGARLYVAMNYEIVSGGTRKKNAEGNWFSTPLNVMQKELLKCEWDAVIMDEAQRIKAAGGGTSHFMSKMRGHSKRMIALSGTPAHNSWADVYAIYRALSPDIFGTNKAAFMQRYFLCDPFGKIIRCIDEKRLHAKFYRIAYRVKTDDVLDLPPATHTIIECELEPEARKIYDQLDEELIAEVADGTVTAANGAVKLGRLLQLTGGWLVPLDDAGEPLAPVMVSGAKIKALEELLSDLAANEPVVVFAYYQHDLMSIAALAKRLEKRYGEISGRAVGNGYEDWRTGTVDILGVQVRAGGVGIDLTRARVAVVYSLGLISPGDWEQAWRRLVRAGQNWPVSFQHLHCAATEDGPVYSGIKKGKRAIDAIMDRKRPHV